MHYLHTQTAKPKKKGEKKTLIRLLTFDRKSQKLLASCGENSHQCVPVELSAEKFDDFNKLV